MLLLILLVAGKGIQLKIEGRDFMGLPPVAKPLFIAGKTASFLNWSLFAYRALTIDKTSAFSVHPSLSWVGSAFLCAAVILVYASFISLGGSNRLGLPGEKTAFRTGGIYRISRNPMYLGFGLISCASALYYPNPVNIVLALLSIYVHHAILLSEEKFLAERFPGKWEDYKKHIPRYLIFK